MRPSCWSAWPRTLLAVAAMTCITIAGCGSVAGSASCGSLAGATRPAAESGSASSPAPGTTRPGQLPGTPPAGSRAEALALARRELGQLRLPPGARRTAVAQLPGQLRDPDLYAGGQDSADLHLLFALPESMAAADGFLLAHAPAGLPVSSHGEAGSRPGADMENVGYSPHSVPPGIDAVYLLASVVPDGRGSLLRADAQVIWFPPRSVAEYVRAARLHAVTITGASLNPIPRQVSRTITAPAVIAELASLLNGEHAAGQQLASCPLIQASYGFAFRAAAGLPPVLVVSTSGCLLDSVTAGGRAQPALWDPGNALLAAGSRLIGGQLRPNPRIPPCGMREMICLRPAAG